MVKFGESRPEKKAEGIRTEEGKRGEEEKPVWYKTRWGILVTIILILLLFLSVLGKPKWIKIEVSNVFVAFVALGFAYLLLHLLQVKSRVLKVIFGFLWLLFLPNTAYLFTDLGHISYQWSNTTSHTGQISLLVQYLLLELFALIAFLFSIRPFEKIIDRVNLFKKRKVTCLILFNFLIAYGLVLGRFEHINSWTLIANPIKVLGLAINIFVSHDLLRLTIIFGLLCNFIYFFFRGLLLNGIKGDFL